MMIARGAVKKRERRREDFHTESRSMHMVLSISNVSRPFFSLEEELGIWTESTSQGYPPLDTVAAHLAVSS